MLSAAERARLAIVLVGARNPSNVGAAARAMRDFGFSDLRFVNPYTAPFEAAQLEAVSSAVAAGDIMRTARSFASLTEALADCVVVVGTTAIGERALEVAVETLATAAAPLRHALRADTTGRVALLFGSEKTGLTREQLSHCQRLLTIPLIDPAAVGLTAVAPTAEPLAGTAPLASNTAATPRHLSMNLGQAVAVCLYELVREGLPDARPLPPRHDAAATGDDRDRLTQALATAMRTTGYARRFPANAREAVVRRLAGQLGQTRAEATAWLGFLKLAGRSNPAEDDA